MSGRWKKTLLVAGGLLAGVVLAELALQLYTLLSPRRNILARAGAPIWLPDPRLGKRPNPDFWDHDANGYRNPSVPAEAFVVAMGDSQTYGTGVWRSQNWPHQLQERVGRSVYGISCGAWGPTQSLFELERALAFKPRLIVEAFYSGNDLFDCFETVYADHQLKELATTDEKSAQAIRSAEASETLDARYERLYGLALGTSPETPPAGIRGYLSRNSKLYRLASLTRQVIDRKLRPIRWEEEKQDAKEEPGRTNDQVFESAGARTIFTSVLRSAAMDLEDPRIAEGLRIALEALVRMDARTRKAGTGFLVVLIPTKELVFRDLALPALPDARSYRRLVEMEEALRSEVMEFLRKHDIGFVDALPPLRESLARGEQPYKESADGHPNPAGYRAISGVVAGEMERRGLAAKPRGR